jgi:hypothetical protein
MVLKSRFVEKIKVVDVIVSAFLAHDVELEIEVFLSK